MLCDTQLTGTRRVLSGKSINLPSIRHVLSDCGECDEDSAIAAHGCSFVCMPKSGIKRPAAAQHAERLRLRLKLAKYKVDTKQVQISYIDLPSASPSLDGLSPNTSAPSSASASVSEYSRCCYFDEEPMRTPAPLRRHGGILSSAVKGSSLQLHAANELLRLCG